MSDWDDPQYVIRRLVEDMATWPAEKRQEHARVEIEELAKDYHRHRDAFAPWRVYALCRWAGNMELPDWTLHYFDRVARRMQHLADLGDPLVRKDPTDLAAAVIEALEMKKSGRSGRGTALSRRRAAQRRETIARDVLYRMAHDGTKLYVAIEEAAERFRVGRETIRRAWKDAPEVRAMLAEATRYFADIDRARRGEEDDEDE
jgi:hypothetical protein